MENPVLPIRTCKSQILSFFELSDENQKEVIDSYDYEGYNPDEDSFVEFKYKDGGIEAIPLSQFMRIQSGGRYHGSYCTSNSGGFCIILSNSGNSALISLF